MNTSFDPRTAERSNAEPSREDTDITLGAGSLLAIFFGVVVVCGIVFGFGYSLGHHKSPVPPATKAAERQNPPVKSAAVEPQVADGSAASSEAESTTATAPDTAPAAESANPNFPANYTPPNPDESGAEAPPERPTRTHAARGASTQEGAGNAAATAALQPRHTLTRPHAATPMPQEAATRPSDSSAPLMVQIAAVSRQEDAEALAAALRKRGFSAMVRHGLADPLFHIQVGPFANLAQADSMKNRLRADGYNAIVK